MYLQYHVHKHTCTVHVMSTVGSLAYNGGYCYTSRHAVLRAYILGALYILMHTYILTHTYRRSGKSLSQKKFYQSPSTMKIKPAKYFLRHINGVSLYCQVVTAMKLKPGKKFNCRGILLPKNSRSTVHTCTY